MSNLSFPSFEDVDDFGLLLDSNFDSDFDFGSTSISDNFEEAFSTVLAGRAVIRDVRARKTLNKRIFLILIYFEKIDPISRECEKLLTVIFTSTILT